MTARTPADLARFVHPVPVGATIPAGVAYVYDDDGRYMGPFRPLFPTVAGPSRRRWTADPLPTPTPEKDTAMNDLPRVIDPSAARVGDLLELSGYPTDSELLIRGRAHDTGGLLSVGVYSVPRAIKITLLDRPAPALPTAPGTVIDCTLDGDPGAVLVLAKGDEWFGAHANGRSALVSAAGATVRITNWTVRPKPGAES